MNRKKAIVLLVLTAILWSIGGLFIKLIDMNPVAIAGLRSGIAAFVMLVYLKKPSIHLDKINILGAISYAGTLLCFVSANKLTSSANAIFLQYTAPVWVILFSLFLYKEKPKKMDILVILVVLSGMALFFAGNFGPGSSIGNIVALFSGFFMAAMVIFLKKSVGAAVEITFLGNILTFLFSIPMIPKKIPDTTTILCLLILGIFQLGFSYIFYTIAIKHVSSLEGILIPIIEPLLNPIWVLIFTGEKMGLTSLLGGLIIISAVVWHQIKTSRIIKIKSANESTENIIDMHIPEVVNS